MVEMTLNLHLITPSTLLLICMHTLICLVPLSVGEGGWPCPPWLQCSCTISLHHLHLTQLNIINEHFIKKLKSQNCSLRTFYLLVFLFQLRLCLLSLDKMRAHTHTQDQNEVVNSYTPGLPRKQHSSQLLQICTTIAIPKPFT